jgi:hypothetical protein
MPKIFRTSVASEADLKVYVTRLRFEADLIVFESPDARAAEAPAVWTYVDVEAQADRVVYFTERRWEADLVICKTDVLSYAGWVDESKASLL